MNKSYSFYVLLFGMTLAVFYLLQLWVINMQLSQIRYSILNVNVFFAATSLIICILFVRLEKSPSIKPQLGFIYLPTLFVKGLFFYILFKGSVFSIDNLSTSERINLLVPLFVFLAMEVYIIVGILNKETPKI